MTSKRTRCSLCTLYHPNGRRSKCQAVEKRWPLGPLVEAVATEGVTAIADLIGQSGANIHKAAKFGLTDTQADRWAIKVGLHPEQVWPGWIHAGLSVIDAEFVANGWRQAWEWNEAAPMKATA